ncbi:MAG: nuclear transport factor 2 family protein [Sphingomonas sp.]|nr:nuclear transport factor 2 family protein [Sphingomonas sp.]
MNDDTRAILSVIEQFWRALDALDADTARALIAPDMMIIDAFAPFQWAGPNSFDRWVETLWAYCAKHDFSMNQTTLRAPSRFTLADDQAYVVCPAMIASARGDELMSQQGVIVTTLRSIAGTWRITALVWAGQ